MHDNKYPEAPAVNIGGLMQEAENNSYKTAFIGQVESAAKNYREKAYKLEKFAESVKHENFPKEMWETFIRVFDSSSFVWPKN